jgi:hypothetical protein
MTHMHGHPTVSTLVTIVLVFSFLLMGIVWFSKKVHRKRFAPYLQVPKRGFDIVQQATATPKQIANAIEKQLPIVAIGNGTPIIAVHDSNLQPYTLKSSSDEESCGEVDTDGRKHIVVRYYTQQECEVAKNFKKTWTELKNRFKCSPAPCTVHFHKITCDGAKENEVMKCTLAKIDGRHLKFTPTVTVALRGEKNEHAICDGDESLERLEPLIRNYIAKRLN